MLAPISPRLSDRSHYDWVGTHPFAANCTETIYCYRVVAPVIVHAMPGDPGTNWRAYQVISAGVAGALIASLTSTLAAAATAPYLASVLVQTSFGFTFTAYDPYSAEPLVFVIAALLAWCWFTNRPWHALALCIAGVFVKETVALLCGVLALATLIEHFAFARGSETNRDWKTWLLPMLIGGFVLASFHAVSRIWLNWDISTNPAAQLSRGSWLALWLYSNPLVVNRVYMVFATYGFAWLFALLGWIAAPRSWRALALATIPAMLFLIVIQTPERALGNAFFVIVPLAVLFASRSPVLGFAAIAVNGLVTAKYGTSSAWLPSSKWTLIPAAIAAALLVFRTISLKNPGSSLQFPDPPYRRT